MAQSWLIILGLVTATPLLAGSGTNSLLQSPPAPIPSSPSRSQAIAPPRPDWTDPRSLLDESRPPTPSSGSTPQALKSWQQRDLPELDQRIYEMDLRNQPDYDQKFLDEQDWYRARQKQLDGLQLQPKPPLPPPSEPKIGDVTPFDLEPAPAHPAQSTLQAPAAVPSTQPTTRPAE